MRRRRPAGEPLEHHVALFLGDADAVVVDRDLHPSARTDRRQLHARRAAVLDRIGDRVVNRQPQPGGQADDDHRRRGHQRDVEVGVDAHRVVGGAVEQLGDVDRHVVVGCRQLALRKPFQRAEGGLDAGLGSDDVVEHLFALLVGQVEGGQHLEVGAHRGQRRAQLVRGHRGEVARRRQGRLGAVLLVPDALQHALDRLGDLDGLGGAAHLDVGRFVAGVDLPGLLRQPLQRPHRERGQQPPGHGRRADGERSR